MTNVCQWLIKTVKLLITRVVECTRLKAAVQQAPLNAFKNAYKGDAARQEVTQMSFEKTLQLVLFCL